MVVLVVPVLPILCVVLKHVGPWNEQQLFYNNVGLMIENQLGLYINRSADIVGVYYVSEVVQPYLF